MPIPIRIPGLDDWKAQVKCQMGCPVATDGGRYCQLVAQQRYEEGFLVARAPNPFASVCGRVCAAPCEDACRRGSIVNPVGAVRTGALLAIEGTAAFGAASLAFLRFTHGAAGAAVALATSIVPSGSPRRWRWRRGGSGAWISSPGDPARVASAGAARRR